MSFLYGAGLLAAPACSLPPPKGFGSPPDGGIGVGACPAVNTAGPDGGADGGPTTGTGVTVSGDVTNVVTPVACAAVGANPNAIDKYSQGYKQDPGVLMQVQTTLTTMSLADEATQMRGMPYGSAGATQFNDIQRSEDTATIRGFRYRDASRGMNLGEDMDGAFPDAAKVNNQSVGYSTVFPVSMARGASFDLDLEYAVGEAIGDEMQAAKQTLLLAPCMNLLRHPLWGRAQETYGEDPYEIGRMASAMTVGVQQHIAANAKHYMGYDIENNRAANNSQMDEQTLREIYGRHFRMVVQDGGVSSVMASYNLVNMVKSTQNTHTLTDVMRNDFGFKGFILSDWWAMPNGENAGTDTTTLKTTAVQAVHAGLDVELPWGLNYAQLENIVNSKGGLTKADLDASVARILEQKFRFKADSLTGNLGLGSPSTIYANSQINCSDAHVALAERAARESMVLLKNDGGVLPISPAVKKVVVVGATVPYRTTDGGSTNTGGTVDFATDVRTGDLGSSRAYFDPTKGVGPFDGIEQTAPPGVTVTVGSSAADAQGADFVVVMAGLTAQDEGEEYTLAGDRSSLALDAKQTDPQYQNIQNNLITAVAALGKPMVVVLEGGSVIDMPWLSQVPAVVMAWYPGQAGGTALGQLLWGQVGGTSYNFGGKLPFTWGKQLSDYETFNGNGTTNFDYYVGYRYFDHANIAPLYPFGAGISYTTFQYSNLQLGCSTMSQGAVLPVVVNVTNTGAVAGDEIVMVFVSFPNTTARRPPKELKAFARVSLAAGEAKQVTIPLRLSDLDYFQVDSPGATTGHWVVETGPVTIMVGGSSANLPLSGTVNVTGYTVGSPQ
ncbi:MAG TPA: glycoside hydrolase family 3 N-terminal domain-containing protein [Polyangia bacterium]|nr:glycoside hydrolase family 3 N-terminal domain-containing protein [Polyangia bacterium]